VTNALRSATAGDHDAILAVVRDAFTDPTRDGQEEVDIVLATWRLGAAADELELVAASNGSVVGHVVGAWGELDGRSVVGIAPLAVAPDHQGAGVGTALTTELLARAQAAGLPLVVLLGHPGYYARFGFEPAGPLGIHYRAVGADNPNFMVRRLAGYDPSYCGDFTYCWELPPR
jgi:putative acetyltransferase